MITLKNSFSSIDFEVKDKQIFIKSISFGGKTYVYDQDGYYNTLLFLLGGAYPGKLFHRYQKRGEDLNYVSHQLVLDGEKQTLIITENNDKAEVKTHYSLLGENGVLEVYKEVKNIGDKKFSIECACPLAFSGIMKNSGEENSSDLPYFWKAHNTWCTEVNFEKIDLNKEGIRRYSDFSRRDAKYCVSNNGTQTTNRYLPMGVFEKDGYGYLAFELEPKGSWGFEMEVVDRPKERKDFALLVTGKTLEDNGWFKEVNPSEVYVTEKVRLIGNEDLDGVLEQLTVFRRAVKIKHKNDAYNYVIYNNFQHNTWDNPTEESDYIHTECAADCGAEYYVVDAGWHDDRVDGHSPTQAIGTWKENKTNYPNGFIKTVERVRSLGMKFGLWMEVQSYGIFSTEPNLLPEECFIHINGVRPVGNNRYHLDYSNKKTREYFDGVMDRVIKTYNPDYIKIDYNQSVIGNDCKGGSLTEGVCQHFIAYEKWFLDLQERYPDIIFETCSSGGMRNDSAVGRYSNVVSVTDQGDYLAYPYIVANMPMSLLPEQSGYWNMPFNFWTKTTSREEIVFNAVNSLFGVMHLSSKLDLVPNELKELIREGTRYYKQLAQIKDKAIPVMPRGFTSYDDKTVLAGLKTDDKLYLAVYNLDENAATVTQDLNRYRVKSAKITFPSFAENDYSLVGGVLNIKMDGKTARVLEFDIW